MQKQTLRILAALQTPTPQHKAPPQPAPCRLGGSSLLYKAFVALASLAQDLPSPPVVPAALITTWQLSSQLEFCYFLSPAQLCTLTSGLPTCHHLGCWFGLGLGPAWHTLLRAVILLCSSPVREHAMPWHLYTVVSPGVRR